MAGENNNQVILTAEDSAGETGPGDSLVSELAITNNEDAGIYEARLDGTAAAGVVYTRTGHRMSILATSVFPQFRGRGVAATLLAAVFEDARGRGDTITVTCPFTATFVESHPEYSDLIDPSSPGAPRRQHHPEHTSPTTHHNEQQETS